MCEVRVAGELCLWLGARGDGPPFRGSCFDCCIVSRSAEMSIQTSLKWAVFRTISFLGVVQCGCFTRCSGVFWVRRCKELLTGFLPPAGVSLVCNQVVECPLFPIDVLSSCGSSLCLCIFLAFWSYLACKQFQRRMHTTRNRSCFGRAYHAVSANRFFTQNSANQVLSSSCGFILKISSTVF